MNVFRGEKTWKDLYIDWYGYTIWYANISTTNHLYTCWYVGRHRLVCVFVYIQSSINAFTWVDYLVDILNHPIINIQIRTLCHVKHENWVMAHMRSDVTWPVITRCNTLQHTATHCNTLQHTATHCNTLQHTATHCNTSSWDLARDNTLK